MELGILSLSDLQIDPDTGKPFSAAQRVADTLDYAVLADRLGLDLFALGEHHTLDFAVSSPAVVLAAIAARTRKIQLTTAVTVLSALDPVRVYQDFAQLDLVSNGRAEIIAGRSAFVEPFALFGHHVNDYDALYTEKLDLLLRLRDQEKVTWSGRFRPPLHDAQITPRAVQDPLPVWAGVGGSPASAERAGRLGLPMVLGYIGGPLHHARRTVDIYRAAGEMAGHAEKLRVGISTHFFAGPDPRSARSSVYSYYHEYLRPKTPGGRGFNVSRAQFEAGTQRGHALMIGSSAELIEKILDAHEALGIDRFFAQFDWGGLPRRMVEDSIHRLATEIAPAVRANIPTPPPQP
ncbi:LLM class flavin-dependent oxidoreductase [Micromonospora acroterricola]|uniref:LLM class flavin-dependent oxidoreductase n=1 Tax=Micromonospora acroterricola TaxID=2202421 RepID=A0A317D8U9_9ACTN|nr:LLM class flavin-dependent oxidoreductase [Micromonospora acroterricola]PWR10086.1 LLM class flavin-dependent oxidoreductase [Micromonospora acroterricola]